MADKEEIRERNDIVEVVASFVTLKKRGRNWVGLCPFHQEKTPSFNVDAITRSYKCFGCGESGDIFSFVQKYQNMTFVEAAEFLAKRVGLTLDRMNSSDSELSDRAKLFEINGIAREWFSLMLSRVPEAKDYLYERGVTFDIIQQFQLGYAPEGWDNLTGYMETRRYDLAMASVAGLIHVGKTSSYYDIYRKRIMFPIHDEQERIVGFGGRAMGDEQPKYLNTGETPLFNKSKLLYGLPFARRKIAAEGKTLIMEGYMDVIAAHQAGFTNAVATLGTSLTEEHAKKLARLAPMVVLVYDGDNAGIKATLRSSEILEAQGVEVRVVSLPAGDDPDSLLKRGEISTFQRSIDNALGRVEYQLDRIIAGADQSSAAGRAKMLLQIVAILSTIGTRAERDVYIEQVWRYHSMSSSGPGPAKEQMHRDAETYKSTKKMGSMRQPPHSSEDMDEMPPMPGEEQGSFGREYQEEPEHTYQFQNQIQPRYARQSDQNQREEGGWKSRPRKFERPRRIVKPPIQTDGPRAAERAEKELLRALLEPGLKSLVLNSVTTDFMLTDFSREILRLVSQNSQITEEADLLATVENENNHELAEEFRLLLQEFHALMVNVPMTQALVEDCVRTLKKFKIQCRCQELARYLHGRLEIAPEDLELQREYLQLQKELKGSSEIRQ